MQAIFGGGQSAPVYTAPEPLEAPATPSVDEARENVEEYDRLLKRRGRMATFYQQTASNTASTQGSGRQVLG